jgi:hypothetical protein
LYRLYLNRKSAKKCRLKKKAEQEQILKQRENLVNENKELQQKINQISDILLKKIEEHQEMMKKLEAIRTE